MSNRFDFATRTLGAGLPRREALRVLATGVLGFSGLGFGWGRTPEVTTSAPSAPIGTLVPEVTIKLTREGGGYSGLRILDRQMARVTLPGQNTRGFVALVLEDLGQVEISIYDVPSDIESARFLRRITLPINGESPAPLDNELLQGVSLGIVSVAAREQITVNGPDCCVDCAWGRACASAVCCDPGCEECGHCCDPGSCVPPICEI